MGRNKTWRWEFFAFRSQAEGRPVTTWFEGLPDDHADEVIDRLDMLKNYTSRPWPEFAFDSLNGEGGISEIRFPDFVVRRGGEYKLITYRIYGRFGPEKRRYTFLHGAEKDVTNDQTGKQIARGRLQELERGTAGVYKFEYEEETDSEAQKGPLRPN